ncbi:MAG TPA: sensor domain-containing diguanylate cyclase, partial [Candidatus Kapabacteria bacterium]|nr:sensor domain-containing diguanylate cyclase [Candidatus Kapabacteria bacterium]
MTLFSQLLSDMGMLVLECKPGPVFVALNRIPDWFQQIHSAPLGADAMLDVVTIFPFIAHFIEDADVFWRNPVEARLGSGVWTELDEQGKQHQLEAYALLYQNTRILLLVDLSASFDARHQVYQRAREIALEQERLVMSLRRQQRKLQLQLQGLLTRDNGLASIDERIRQHASAVMVCRPDGSVELLNQALMDIYPVAGNNGTRAEYSLLKQWVSEAEALYPEIHRVIETGASWEGEFESSAGSDKKWVRLLIGPVLDQEQRVTHLVCVANDISGLREPALELERVTDFDFTTQLPNRRHFWRVLTRAIDECRASGEKLVLLYLDVDHFKRINDSLDHQAGDLLLGTLSSRLRRNIKKADFIAHLGGDEFALMLRTSQRTQDLLPVAERLLGVVRQPLVVDGHNVSITASIGIACFPEHGNDAVGLMKRADLAMYHAKQRGRDQLLMFSRSLDEAF